MWRPIIRNVLLCTVSLGLIFVLSYFDQEISQQFFQDGHFAKTPFLDFVYRWGLIPGWILFGLGLAACFTSTMRREGIYIILVLAIGSGIISHFFLKEGWPRPRPKQVIEYGGRAEFHPLFALRGKNGPYRSLPCGHATMGFYFASLIPIGRKWNNSRLVWAGILGTLILGSILSYTRIAQGGHFFSDTLMAFFVMGATTYFLRPILYERANAKTA